jgi:UDP-3-O-[3-hydroxymyristoyl] glucosamine N-acyltransferase
LITLQVSLAQLVQITGGQLDGPPDRVVSGLKGIEEAGPEDVAFLANPRYAKTLPDCRAGVVLVHQDQEVPQGLAVIRVSDPYLAYAKLLTVATQKPYESIGVHDKAVVADSAELGRDVSIHAMAVVGEGVRLGDRVVIHPGAVVGAGCRIGDDTVLHPNAVLYQGCIIGKRCIVHAGAVIGADGFGFAPDGDKYYKIPQIGIVRIEDDVEIGANTTIDRAATQTTLIKRGVKIDNLVQIGHNCEIGEDTVLAGQVGIAGSTKLGRHVVAGGQAGIGGHLTLGDNVKVAGQGGVSANTKDNAALGGTPAMPVNLYLKTTIYIRKLPELFKRVKALEKKSGDSRSSS